MDHSRFECAVIGDWHLAFTTAVCLAQLGRRTLLVRPEAQGGMAKQFPPVPLHEPGMADAIATATAQGLLQCHDGIEGDWSADLAWLAIDTPVDDFDRPDVAPLEKAISKLGNRSGGNLVISSQIPLGFARKIAKQYGLHLAYVPENLRLGKGIETFLNADRTVIGADEPEIQKKTLALLQGVQTEFFFCDLVTAEMVKHATNAFLATSISFANEIARIGETMGVDCAKVAQALKLDKRIGKQAYVAPGLGFAGGTLPRDLRILQGLGKESSVPTPLFDAVLEINESTSKAIVQSIKSYFSGNAEGKMALLLGYTYKAETDTLRRSPAIELAGLLKGEGMKVAGFDPVMNGKDLSPLRGLIEHHESLGGSPVQPDLILILTARSEFQNLDWRKFASKAALVFDTRGYLSSDRILGAGLAYKALWQPTKVPQ